MENTVIITGTSSGIGNGLARAYCEKGDRVFGISRRSPEDLVNRYTNYRHLELDLTHYDGVSAHVAPFLQHVEVIDLLVLNSGVLGEIKDLAHHGLEEMKQVMEINVWANKYLLDLLYAQHKAIRQVIGMSTRASLRSLKGWGPYSLSKAALNMLMNLYAGEYKDTHFTAFAPGLVQSHILDYVNRFPNPKDYPAVEFIQKAQGTPDMPDPDTAATKLIRGFEKALEHQSGLFLDVRDMQ